ncbi:CDP-6-deoxy-L-threo-D-glycero-4-hexulose-3-dehydrase reductase [Pseudomonas sp. 8AS]|nr:CDP-6-deoxy-L-threo-D-glycero-4-hexulose-3-dehydrase reductase [Pseudomonas sp. 8AS]
MLVAARMQGIALEHSCRTGRCGVCKARVLAGVTEPLQVEDSLTQDERSRGIILTCCRTAVTDIELDIEDLGELGNVEVKTLPCRIHALHMLSDDVVEVALRLPPTSPLHYLPGQYIDIIKGGIRRSYSIANAPRDDGRIILQIRKVPDGEMSRYWFEEAKENDLLRLEGPLGTFCLRQTQVSQLVLLATGTGIAPIKAILQQLAKSAGVNTYRKIHVYWGGRVEKDLYWTPDFPEFDMNYVSVLSRSLNSSGAQGYVQDAVIAAGINLQDAVVYACGSESMIESARNKLIAAGLGPENFHSDAFVSSN